MDFAEFRSHLERDEPVADYIDDIAQQVSDTQNRSVGLDVLFGIVAYALYRLAKNYLDHQRGLQNAELRQTLEGEVQTLVAEGWDRHAALKAVLSVSDTITKLQPEDPIVRAAITVLTRIH